MELSGARHPAWMVIGCLGGSVVAAAIRTMYYHARDLQPAVAPEMGFIMFPVLAIPLALVALILHMVLHRFFAYKSGRQWFLAGACYGLWFLAFVGPYLLVVPIFANPPLIRIAGRLLQRR
jgi:hypothetical protein